MTRYYDSPDAYAKVRALAAEFPNIASVEDLPEKTWGYQRPAATMLGYQNAPTTQQPNPRPNATSPYVIFDDGSLPGRRRHPVYGLCRPSTVVITSKVMGHLGGNSLTARLLAPDRRQPAAERRRLRQRVAREPRLQRRRARSPAPPTR